MHDIFINRFQVWPCNCLSPIFQNECIIQYDFLNWSSQNGLTFVVNRFVWFHLNGNTHHFLVHEKTMIILQQNKYILQRSKWLFSLEPWPIWKGQQAAWDDPLALRLIFFFSLLKMEFRKLIISEGINQIHEA